MITVYEARILAEQKHTFHSIGWIYDVGDRWIVCFDAGDPPVPGVPIIAFDKDGSGFQWLSIPPFSNLDLINSGKLVPRKEWDPDFVE